MTTKDESVARLAAEMQRVNEDQKAYYERDGEDLRKAGNLATKTWAKVRGRVSAYRSDVGIKEDLRQLQNRWLGELGGLDVMELGCDSGNSVTRFLAANSKSYLGVDLNSVGVAKLNAMLKAHNLPGEAVAIDFLNPDFPYGPFDVVYANGVLHHFRHLDALLSILHSRMKPGGKVVAFDPLQTAFVPRLVRSMYRPFQSDSDWEWPFSKSTFSQFDKYFEVREVQGMLGMSKWGIMAIPFGRQFASSVGRRLHRMDMNHARQRSSALWRCMNVATLLVKREA